MTFPIWFVMPGHTPVSRFVRIVDSTSHFPDRFPFVPPLSELPQTTLDDGPNHGTSHVYRPPLPSLCVLLYIPLTCILHRTVIFPPALVFSTPLSSPHFPYSHRLLFLCMVLFPMDLRFTGVPGSPYSPPRILPPHCFWLFS